MAAKKVGTLVKEARVACGLTQEQLARKIAGVSANDISRVERGEIDLTNDQYRLIAKITGVTQTSLVNAPKNVAKKTTTSTAAKSTTAAKKTSTAAKKTSTAAKKTTTAAKKTSTATAAKKTTTTTAAKKPATPANANSTMKVTATERKLVEAYREAGGEAKKAAVRILKGESANLLPTINAKDTSGSVVEDLVSNLLGNFLGNK